MSVIEFSHVSKAYQLGTATGSLREALAGFGRRLSGRETPSHDEFQALDDVSFAVERGEVLGIIGHNGAGKSTTLKLLSRVTWPTTGVIRSSGRMAALIELGAGFHPDLSGRENVYLNGAILGLRRSEIAAAFDDIVEFAGLERFIDTPIKRYSSGMYVRLAFAVAAHVRADLLLVDEVLSVGDMAFQQKCLARMNELRESGTTIVYISHNLWSVSTFCHRALLLQGGRIIAEGRPDDVIQTYREQERARAARTAAASLHSDAEFLCSIVIENMFDETGVEPEAFDPEGVIGIRVRYDSKASIEAPLFILRITRADGLLCMSIGSEQTIDHRESLSGAGTLDVRVDPFHPTPDYYFAEVHLVDSHHSLVYGRSDARSFRVRGSLRGLDSSGVVQPASHWEVHRC
jgi:lipopolysaccharide transport system ATP-binding protein